MKTGLALVIGIIFLPIKLLGVVARMAQSQFMVGVDATDTLIDWFSRK